MKEAFFKRDEAFIIAEVGQNHQGDSDIALEYVRVFAKAGANAIKFQTRDNRFLFSADAYNRVYESENSFGHTYGEHREALELSVESLSAIKEECRLNGVYFMSTPFDEPSLDRLIALGVDVLKIASFDLGNLPFINRMARVGVPLVMSIGGGNVEHIDRSVRIIEANEAELAVLHCVSEYPTDWNRLRLGNIVSLKDRYPNHTVGLSDHFSGTLSGPLGFAFGARVFEKHVTLNRAWKGTDHSFALEPDGFRKFVRDIRRVPGMSSATTPLTLGGEPVFKKLGKSICASRKISAGEVLTLDNLSARIYPVSYIPVRDSYKIIGTVVREALLPGQPVTLDMIGEFT